MSQKWSTGPNKARWAVHCCKAVYTLELVLISGGFNNDDWGYGKISDYQQ